MLKKPQILMELIKTSGFIKIFSFHHRKIIWYLTVNYTTLSNNQ